MPHSYRQPWCWTQKLILSACKKRFIPLGQKELSQLISQHGRNWVSSHSEEDLGKPITTGIKERTPLPASIWAAIFLLDGALLRNYFE